MTEFCTWTLIVCFTLRTVILQPKHFKQFENKSESIAVTGLTWHHSLWFFSCSLKSPSHFNYIIMQWILNWGWMCVQPSPTLEMVYTFTVFDHTWTCDICFVEKKRLLWMFRSLFVFRAVRSSVSVSPDQRDQSSLWTRFNCQVSCQHTINLFWGSVQ